MKGWRLVVAFLLACLVTVVWAPLHYAGVLAELIECHAGRILSRVWKWAKL